MIQIYFAHWKNLLTKDAASNLIWAYFNWDKILANVLTVVEEQILTLRVVYHKIDMKVKATIRQDVKNVFVYDKQYWLLFALDLIIEDWNIIPALIKGNIYLITSQDDD